MKFVALSEAADVQMGTAPPGTTYNERGEGMPMIAGAGDYGALNPKPKKWTTRPTRVANTGDLIVCVRATIGDLNWADKEYCLGRGVAGVRAIDGVADKNYLAYFISSQKEELMKLGTGSTFLAIRRDDLKGLQVPLPPLEEQKRIAAILDKADAIRRKRQAAIELADQFLRSVFLDMFGDPVANPKEWPIFNLKELAKIQIGPFGTQLHKEDYIEGGIPLINPSHIKGGKLVPNHKLSIGRLKHESLPEYHLVLDDIVMGRRGEMGRCAIVNEKEVGWMCGTGSLIIRSIEKGVFSEYLYSLLTGSYVKSYLESESLGATLPNLNKGIVESIRIPVPDNKAMKKYKKARSIVDGYMTKNKSFDDIALFESLSQKSFKGELTQ